MFRAIFYMFVVAGLSICSQTNAANDDLTAGLAAADRGDWNAAIELVTQAIDAGSLSREEMLLALEARSGSRISLGQIGSALEDCETALSIDPDYGPALINRGVVRIIMGKPNLALPDLSKAIKGGRLSAVGFRIAHFNRGRAWYLLNNLERATRDFDAAISFDARWPSAYAFRGRVQFDQKQYDAAFGDFDKAIALAQDFSAAYTGRGAVNLELGHLEEALADLNHAIRLEDLDPEAYFYRGQVRLVLREFGSAVADFDRAIELSPMFPKAAKARGIAKFNMGHYEAAAKDIKSAQKGAESNDDTTIWLYLAWRRAGDPKSAELELKRRLSWKWNSLKSAEWPEPLLRHFGKQLSEGDVLRAAQMGDAAEHGQRACDAKFYLAEWALISDNAQRATQLFRDAIDICPITSRERVTAQTEAARLAE